MPGAGIGVVGVAGLEQTIPIRLSMDVVTIVHDSFCGMDMAGFNGKDKGNNKYNRKNKEFFHNLFSVYVHC